MLMQSPRNRAIVFVSVVLACYCLPYAQELTKPTGPKKINFAVLTLKATSGVNQGESELISDRLRGDLFNTGKANVMERDQMQEVLKEQGFQKSGACSDEACLVEMGQMLGVEQLVTGSIGKLGSMFMLNVRAVDVQTGRIIKVVSIDIKGDIEDVVDRLKDITIQLTNDGSEQVKSTKVASEEVKKVVEIKEETKTRESPVKKEDTAQVKVTSDKETPKVEDTSEKALRNKNRGGMRIELLLYGNKVNQTYFYDSSDYYGLYHDKHSNSVVDSNFSNVSRTPLLGMNIKWGIKAGPFNTVDLGFGYMHQKTTFTSNGLTYNSTWTDDFHLFALKTGINFVKRWYPVKLNLGVLVDYNLLTFIEEIQGRNDTLLYDASFNISYGPRVGMEILLGKKIGFNVDFQYMYSEFTTPEETFTSSNQAYVLTTSKRFRMPAVGGTVGVNFYF